jgi:chaperonin GroEL (HSP60 family)
VKAPGFGDRRKAMLEDIAILTGGKVIAEEPPVCQTLRNQIQSKPVWARRSSSASGTSSNVARRPNL